MACQLKTFRRNRPGDLKLKRSSAFKWQRGLFGGSEEEVFPSLSANDTKAIAQRRLLEPLSSTGRRN